MAFMSLCKADFLSDQLLATFQNCVPSMPQKALLYKTVLH